MGEESIQDLPSFLIVAASSQQAAHSLAEQTKRTRAIEFRPFRYEYAA
jgi:hypothetical protein